MPRQQLELAPGELVAREARSHHDLPDDADGGRWANLLIVGDGLLGGVGAWELRRAGVVGPKLGADPSMQSSSPPSCDARGHRPIFAACDRRSTRELRSAKWCSVEILDSNVRHTIFQYCSQSLRKVS